LELAHAYATTRELMVTKWSVHVIRSVFMVME
jgi:hypothetical protein